METPQEAIIGNLSGWEAWSLTDCMPAALLREAAAEANPDLTPEQIGSAIHRLISIRQVKSIYANGELAVWLSPSGRKRANDLGYNWVPGLGPA